MIKIICTGNPSHGGIAQSLASYYDDICFVSLSSGFDLTRHEDFQKFLDLVKNFNVFINHSQISHGMQQRLLESVADIWKTGHIITIGSVLEFDEFKWIDPITHQEKLEIRNSSLRLASEKIKTTHLITSGFQRYGPEEDVKIDPCKIVKIIDYVLKADVDIPLIFVDDINDIRYNKWRCQNPNR
jgi:hypothetical protein